MTDEFKIKICKSLLLASTIFVVGCMSSKKSADDPPRRPVESNGPLPGLGELEQSLPRTNNGVRAAFQQTLSPPTAAWIYFYTNQRYYSGSVWKISDSVYRAMANIGTYTESDGHIELKVQRTTCKPQVEAYRGVTQVSGNLSADRITLTRLTYTMTLTSGMAQILTSSPNGALVNWGCLDPSNNGFSPSSWVDFP